jgi:hypothetical protein
MQTQKLVEVENDRGETQIGVVERTTEDGKIFVRILANDKVLVFESDFLTQ